MFQDVLRKKETFLDDKNYTIKKDHKPDFFAGINPYLWLKNSNFFILLQKIGQDILFQDVLHKKTF